jgi:uncharacterized protein YndB with AHSA1/START domain
VTEQAKDFVIARTFDAPRELVWKAYSEAERLAQWWGPKGCKLKIVSLDFRPGGIFHYGMEWSNGSIMWGRFVYREMVPPERLVFVTSFSDEKGGVTRAPFNEHWPLEVLSVVTFEDAGGKTKITIRSTPVNANKEEREAFEGFFDSMNQGYSGTFDQLDVYLAKVQS